MAEIRNQLFGKLAIGARLITQEQLDECLADQRDAVTRGDTPPKLGELFERKGFLTRAQIAALLQSMETMKRRLFGEIGIELHFITSEQLQTGLEIQRYLKSSVESVPLFGMALVVYRGLLKRMASSKSVAKIGEILIDMGYMRPHQVEIVLQEQAKVLVTCGSCHATLNIGGMEVGQKVRCGQCGLILTVVAGAGGALSVETPKDADVVAEEDHTPAPPRRKTEAMKAVATGYLEIKDEKKDSAVLKKATVIGDFTIVARIGQDASGTLYKARQTSKNRLVVLKLLHESVMQDKAFLQKYTEAAKKAAALDHPGIKKLFLLGQYNSRTFIAMEYAEGESVLNIINREGKIPYERALSIALKITSALAYAAGKGVFHGDVRPSNILILKSGEVKVSNLGLAGKTVENILAITKAGQNAPFYIAPEQVTGDREIDVRTDIYSLGATLYHMVAGRPPYEGQSPFEILMRLTEETIAPLKVYDPSVPDPFSRLVDRMLQVEPVDRYPSYDDLIADMKKLSEMAKSQEIEAVKLPDAPRKTRSYIPGVGNTLSLAPAPTSSAPVSIFDEPKPTPREEAARPKPPWGLIGVGAAALLLVVWFFFLRGPGEDPPDLAALKEIFKYQKDNPENYSELVEKLEQYSRKYTESEHRKRAIESKDVVQNQWNRKARDKFDQLKGEVDSCLNAAQFAKARAVWEKYPAALKTTEVQNSLQRNLQDIDDRQKNFISAAVRQIPDLLIKKDYDGALKILTEARTKLGSDPAGADLQKEIDRITTEKKKAEQDAATAAAGQAKREAESLALANDTAEKAVALTVCFQEPQAVALLGDAATRVLESHREILKTADRRMTAFRALRQRLIDAVRGIIQSYSPGPGKPDPRPQVEYKNATWRVTMINEMTLDGLKDKERVSIVWADLSVATVYGLFHACLEQMTAEEHELLGLHAYTRKEYSFAEPELLAARDGGASVAGPLATIEAFYSREAEILWEDAKAKAAAKKPLEALLTALTLRTLYPARTFTKAHAAEISAATSKWTADASPAAVQSVQAEPRGFGDGSLAEWKAGEGTWSVVDGALEGQGIKGAISRSARGLREFAGSFQCVEEKSLLTVKYGTFEMRFKVADHQIYTVDGAQGKINTSRGVSLNAGVWYHFRIWCDAANFHFEFQGKELCSFPIPQQPAMELSFEIKGVNERGKEIPAHVRLDDLLVRCRE